MKSWNIFFNQRWLRITLATSVLVSMFVILSMQNHTMEQVLEKIPTPNIIASTTTEPLPVKPVTLESPLERPKPPEKPVESSEKPEETSEKPVESSEKSAESKEKPAESQEKKPDIITPPEYILAPKKTSDNKEKLAYVTFLSGTIDAGDNLEEDNYFVAVRILIWQLLHNPETRTKHDVIVMVTPSVSQSRRDRLKKDGATLHAVEFLHTPNDKWLHPKEARWSDLMTKFRAWEMTQYDRILMLDCDTLLVKSLDPVFDDPAAQLLATKPTHDNATLPSTYLMAADSEVWDSNHAFPPGHGTGLKKPGYMNAGFLILAPSLDVFEYYKSLIDTPNSFDPKYQEQNLINHAHRWDGPMPWRELAYTWNLRCPNDNDLEKGVYSVHEKWWTQPFIYDNEKTKQWLRARRWEMKGWYDAWDRAHEESTT